MVQRRQFINAAHDPMHSVHSALDLTTTALREHPSHPHHVRKDGHAATSALTPSVHHLPLGFFVPGPPSLVSSYDIVPSQSTAKAATRRKGDDAVRLLVLSHEEQEAFARIDSVISQLHSTRNLIRRRWFVE